MTRDDVKAEVELIRQMVDDPEVAHSSEDDLYRQVMIAIKDGDHPEGEGPWLALEALATVDILDKGWYA